MNQISRRSALLASLTTLLAAGAASVLPTTTQAAPEPATAQQQPSTPTIDAAEVLLLEVETILLQLDGSARCDLSVELERLLQIAGSADARGTAEDWPRNTGENRASRVDERAHALAHRDIIPQYGALIAAGTEAGKPYGLDFRAREAAEAPFERVYADAKAAYIERYGEDGRQAWGIAWSFAMFGHCEDCDGEGSVA